MQYSAETLSDRFLRLQNYEMFGRIEARLALDSPEPSCRT